MVLHSSEPSEDPLSAPPLPPDIIFDILKRLPVKSLLRFRSVCKLWCSIICDPRFIKSHLSMSTANNLYKHHRLIFSTVRRIICINSCPLYDGGFVNDAALELDYPLKHLFNSVWIVGSCNGLLLIASKDVIKDDVLFVWNPSTRSSITLQNSGNKQGHGQHATYGFGYDESIHDYKVVGISSVLRHDSDGHRYDTIVNIYSLKTGNWKKIEDFIHGYAIKHSVKFSNGALHWAAGRNSGSSYSWNILSLDLAKETYAEILQPVYDEGHTDLTLGVLGGWLCVLSDYDRNRGDVWVMKVKDSWTKLVSIPYGHTDFSWYQASVPLCISNDGKVLLQLGLKLVVYDSKNRSFSKIQNFNGCLEAYISAESLVSPISLRARAGDNNDG